MGLLALCIESQSLFFGLHLIVGLTMIRLIKSLFRAAGLLGVCLLASAASAQQPLPKPSPQRPTASPPAAPGNAAQSQTLPSPPQAAPQPTSSPVVAPQRTTATYDDWIVQCDTVAGPPSRKTCEMTQLTQSQVQGKIQPFSRAIVPKPEKDQASILVVQLPVNVTFSVSVKVQSSDSDPGISTSFARCIPEGCFASFEMKEETLKKFRAATSGGKLSFADASGRAIAVPISFNGFAKAYDALLKE
jgi:invasion protein IalB